MSYYETLSERYEARNTIEHPQCAYLTRPYIRRRNMGAEKPRQETDTNI
jgi:hypothetical protein